MRLVKPSAARAVVMLLASSALASAALAGTITGTVADSTGVRPLQGAEVRIPSLGRTTQADAAGRFRFTDLPAGTYDVTARFAGAGLNTQAATVTAEGTLQLNFALSPEGTDIETILVIGQQANLLSSISRQRAADGVVSVLTRDAIGQFPDQNVAESIRRAPGVNVLNDQGEGRFVAVRGLDPNLNAASINGVRVPAPESDVRSVALDVIPSELIESIEIKKSLTPDMDADTIGASIEINTVSAFDRKTGFATVTLEGSYNDLSGKLSPKGAVDFAARLGEDFGIAGGFSFYKRKFSTDNVEMDGWKEGDDGNVFAEDVEFRDYDVTRRRIGATLAFDYRASDSTTLYARGLYSEFNDDESRRRLTFDFGDFDSASASTANGASFSSEDEEIGIERDLKDRFESQTILSTSIGGKTETGPWTLKYDVSYSESKEQERGSVDPVIFARGFEDDELGVTFDYAGLKPPSFAIDFGSETFLDASEYEFDELERTTVSDARDKEWALKGDVAREFALQGGSLTVQGGVKARFRTKDYNADVDVFDGFDGDLTLADVEGSQSYGLANIEPIVGLSEWRDFLDANGYDGFELNDLDSTINSAVSDYRASEDILAGYILGRYENEFARVIAGVRIERTRTDTSGNLVTLIVEEDANGDETETVTIDGVSFSDSYTDFLPSINLRAKGGEDLIFRAGITRSVVRPNFAQFAPRFLVEDGEAEFGNPDLKPYRAWNFDLGAEYYFAPKAVVQAGFFAKSIDNYIINAVFEDGEFNGIAYDEAVIPVNGERASVVGIELAYSQAFTMLPAPFDGLLASLNYTFTDARVDFMGRRIPLPASSKHNFNAVLGYEKNGFSFRIAGAYRDRYLDEVSDDPETDRYVRPHFQLDLSAKYRVTQQIQLFAELVNLNNAKYTAYQQGPGEDRLLQYEEYKWTGKFGVKASF